MKVFPGEVGLSSALDLSMMITRLRASTKMIISDQFEYVYLQRTAYAQTLAVVHSKVVPAFYRSANYIWISFNDTSSNRVRLVISKQNILRNVIIFIIITINIIIMSTSDKIIYEQRLQICTNY